jgi:type IV secretion system protein VirB3
MNKDVLFRGCTRPAMFMGVPYIPFFIAVTICLVLAMYINLFLLVLLPVSIFVLRQVAKQDEMIFRLWWLRMQFWYKARNRKLYQGMWAFSPNSYRNKLPSHKANVEPHAFIE